MNTALLIIEIQNDYVPGSVIVPVPRVHAASVAALHGTCAMVLSVPDLRSADRFIDPTCP